MLCGPLQRRYFIIREDFCMIKSVLLLSAGDCTVSIPVLPELAYYASKGGNKLCNMVCIL
jgi:hypothetical protein